MNLTAELPEEVCRFCGKPKGNHPYKHAFVGLNDIGSLRSRDNERSDPSSSMPTSDQGRVRNAMTGDPVLRLILIRKGIISVADLNEVEQQLEAAGYATATPVGKPRDS